MTMTFSSVLGGLLRHDAGRPLVTFYDHATGERVELSVTTYANWVAKAASLLVDEHGLERGDRLRIDLPTHWLGTVFLGAAWSAGLTITDSEDPDAVVTGPDGLEQWAPRAASLPVLACSLLPLGVRFRDPLPPHVHDVGVEIWSQPDSFIPLDPAEPSDVATAYSVGQVSQAQMWSTAAAGALVTDGGRLLSEANPASPPGIATVTEPFAKNGSLVLVAHADPEQLEATYAAERATARFPRIEHQD
ncbi:TIGR03089 family protein [Nocardioides sp. zg-DK7169]|uniref:TIGR03089 family protein n=1 Tax=Nocardioides sp. zg-DK7169 TaxID=2736600 RepID=UPI001555B57A|nr:TIGR03089 family protein [Nocardioides sp. zg-DK7169]NPC95910.1 TIGR03089 family protein [Nocardioides sp. zg-DK7169]